MWQQLALSGLKSVQDNQNRRNDIASNVITQKYSPWTGARADFGAQGKNNNLSNMLAGYGSGILQDKLDAQSEAEKTAQEVAKQTAEAQSDHEYYTKLSTNPASVGASPRSAFAGVAQQSRAPASRAPAVDPVGNMERQAFPSLFQPQYQDPTPLMLQGQVPSRQQNPWEMMMKGMVR